MNKGIFYGVSVGPGDPELLTCKAVRILQTCRVIAAPQTKSGEMLALHIAAQAVDMTEKTIIPLHFPMARDKIKQRAAHERAAELVRDYLDAGEAVAMLNLGDVSIYSTCSYVTELLQEQGYQTCSIPGVPSFCAVAAELGDSLTVRDDTLHIIPGGEAGLEEMLSLPGTKVLMKSGRQMPAVLTALEQSGQLEKSAMVQNCGLPNQRVYAKLTDLTPEDGTGYFATIIVKE